MTFLSTQTFDSDNEIKVVTKKRKILDEASGMDVQADGTIKAKARIKFDYGAVTKDDVTPFASIEDAEAYLLEEGNMFWAMGCPPINYIEEDSRFAHRISNAMANISMRGKRGFGNTVVYHPSCKESIALAISAIRIPDKLPDDLTSEEQVMWTMQNQPRPYLNEHVNYIEHDGAPDDTVLVMFLGDDPTTLPLMFADGFGLVVNNHVADAENCGKFVRIP
jgi:hypothetical protein